MTFRRTAALGLSALMISGNMLLPYATATTMAVNSQADAHQQFADMTRNPIFLAMAEQQVQHPIKAKKRTSLFSMLNPLAWFFNGKQDTQKKQVAKAAKSVPIQKHAAKPLTPEIAINPALGAPQPAAEQTATQPAEQQPTTDTSPVTPTTTPSQNLQANPAEQPAAEPDVKPAQPAQTAQTTTPQDNKENADQVYPIPAAGKINLTKAGANEIFQMLATSPLDQLAAAGKGMSYSPALDSSNAPSISLRNTGNVTVLKSGISQKITQVDLAVGKAEVIYLSKPASRVSVSNPDVASAVVISPTQIQLVGKAVGVSNLLVWGDLYSPDHTVVDVNVHRDVSVLINQLRYVDPGIQIVPMAAEDTVILTGQANSRETAQMAIEMAKAFFNKVSNPGASSTAQSGPSSQAPGSALPGGSTNVINLIKVKGEPSTKIELVRQRLMEVDPNINIDVVPGPEGNEKIILTGRVPNASIAAKALNLASVFYGQPGMKLVTAQGGSDLTRLSISATSSSSGSSSSSTATSGPAAGNPNMLQGSVMTDATGNVISMLEIAQKPQIRCNIKFLELNKGKLNAFGHSINGVHGTNKFTSRSGMQAPAPNKPISTPSSDPDPGTAWSTFSSRGTTGNGWIPTAQNFGAGWAEVFQNGVTQAFTIDNRMVVALQALQERNHARTLAEPTLTMLSGEQGSFLAGGEVPIAFQGGQGQVSIEYKEFGIRLNLLPVVTDDGKIQMQVSPEVSTLDRSIAVLGVPGFATRRMNTTLLMEPGQSFVLAGLFKEEDTDSVSRFPGIGSLPVIGSFFKNKWFSRSNTEMVVVVKPEIIYSQTGTTQRHAATDIPSPSELKVDTPSDITPKQVSKN